MPHWINRKVFTFTLAVLLCYYEGYSQTKISLGVGFRYMRMNELSGKLSSPVSLGINMNRHNAYLFYMNDIFNDFLRGGVGLEYSYNILSQKKVVMSVEPEMLFWFTSVKYNEVNVNVPGDPNLYNKNAIVSALGAGLEYSLSPHLKLKIASKIGWCYSYNRIHDSSYDNLPKKYSDANSSFYLHLQVGIITRFKI